MYELIQHQKIDSDSANITFTNIPQNWTDLHIVMSLRGQSERMFFINFNDYSIAPTVRYLYGIGSSVGSEAPGLATAGFGSLSTDTANTFGSISLTIPNYTSSAVKSYSSDSVSESNATFSFQAITAGIWNSTAAINNIRITCRSGNIIAGSSATLYGINRTSAFGKPKAIGGNITYSNGYWVHTFTGSGTFYAQQDLVVDSLVVAGGAGGSLSAGGGGAGGFRFVSSQQIFKGAYPVLVGSGGAVGVLSDKSSRGENSAFNSIVSAGGGPAGGGIDSTKNGESGGSGGGGGFPNSASGTGNAGAGNTPSTTPSQGFSGGSGQLVFNQVANGGGGGGAGGAGAAGTTSTAMDSGSGNGGAGAVSTITGSSVTYSIGGSGNAYRSNYVNLAPANSGNGGSSGYWTGSTTTAPLAGGSGVVIVRYRAD